LECRCPLERFSYELPGTQFAEAFYKMYAWFVAAFRSAAEKLKQGDREARRPLTSPG